MTSTRRARGEISYRTGLAAEERAASLLVQEGWEILARRVRTPFGELDLIAANNEMLLMVEVKRRATLVDAAFSVSRRQAERLLAATDFILQTKPDWRREDTRFDILILDAELRVRRVKDALRLM
ncbi:YraN family protein [Kozakia baliensis]|uniref:YraN family protein n=1 Tax=Kozakia baliensis TaxID=153496 RepID=UPI001563EAAC|nr:YraN family protein [Kozakia baliensis]